LRKFHDGFPGLLDNLTNIIIEKHQLKIDYLPSWEDGDSCKRYEAKLCRELTCGPPTPEGGELEVGESGGVRGGYVEPTEQNCELNEMEESKGSVILDLVCIFNVAPLDC